MVDDDDYRHDVDEPRYRKIEDMKPNELRNALLKLELLGDDLYLRLQAVNLGLVDDFMNQLEHDLRSKMFDDDKPLELMALVSALSQMWIFSAYELMRTWCKRAEKMITWAENGGLKVKLDVLEQHEGYQHHGKLHRAAQIKRVLSDPAIIERVKVDLKRTKMAFMRVEALRMILAKHEIAKKPNSVALAPGYARIDDNSGSMNYELENGQYSMGYVSRRDIADDIRAFLSNEVPSDEDLKGFEAYMRGPRKLEL